MTRCALSKVSIEQETLRKKMMDSKMDIQFSGSRNRVSFMKCQLFLFSFKIVCLTRI